MLKDDKNCQPPISMKLWGVVSIGSKWQIVIPKEVRDALNLDVGDSLAVIYATEKWHIGLIKNDDMWKLIAFAQDRGIHFEY